jgi:hypothetical protein
MGVISETGLAMVLTSLKNMRKNIVFIISDPKQNKIQLYWIATVYRFCIVLHKGSQIAIS